MAEQRNIPLAPPLADDDRFRILAELAARLQDSDLTPLLVYLIDLTPSSALPWLAGQFAVTGDNGWNLADSEDSRRALIKNAIELHRYKGTPWSVRQVIRSLGFGEVEITEGAEGLGPDITSRWPASAHWALYGITLTQPITNDQAVMLHRLLEEVAPARCHLVSLNYQSVAIRYNNTARHDGEYNHGSA